MASFIAVHNSEDAFLGYSDKVSIANDARVFTRLSSATQALDRRADGKDYTVVPVNIVPASAFDYLRSEMIKRIDEVFNPVETVVAG